jgi:hypothetical protein
MDAQAMSRNTHRRTAVQACQYAAGARLARRMHTHPTGDTSSHPVTAMTVSTSAGIARTTRNNTAARFNRTGSLSASLIG